MKKDNKTLKVVLVTVLVTAVVSSASTYFVAKKLQQDYLPAITDGKEIVAETNQGKVTADELYTDLKVLAGRSVLTDALDRLMLDKIAPVNDKMKEDADNTIAGYKQQYGEDQFKVLLKQSGFDSEDAFKKVLLLDLQRNSVVSDYIEKNILKEADIKKAYDAVVPQIRASHILIKPASDSAVDLDKAKIQAMDIIAELDKGAKFDELAKKYSADTGSAENGGDLDFFGKGSMVAEFEDAAYALKKGEYTKAPVKSQYGYHIILKTDEKTKDSYEEMKSDLVDQLVSAKLTADTTLSNDILEKVRKENGFKIYDTKVKQQYEDYLKSLEEQAKASEQQ